MRGEGPAQGASQMSQARITRPGSKFFTSSRTPMKMPAAPARIEIALPNTPACGKC